MMLRSSLWVISTMLLLLLAISCSGGNSDAPVSPDAPQIPEPSVNRGLLGIWHIWFDPESHSIDIKPSRELSGHYEVSSFLQPPNCTNCITIVVSSFDAYTRLLSVDVTIRNPSTANARDVRGIISIDAGHILDNADDWTPYWLGPGKNPFRAYAKIVEHRIFASTAEHTENFRIYIPEPPNYAGIEFAVDASWPGNCKEPYEIRNFQQGMLTNQAGSSAPVKVEVNDWQDDVTAVTLNAQDVTGTPATELVYVEGNLWQGEVENQVGVSPGEYECWIEAESNNPDSVSLFEKVTLTVSGVIIDPVDITPAYLNFAPKDIFIQDQYAYIAGSVNGLHIFDISDIQSPVWLGRIELDHNADYLFIEEDLAYIASETEVAISIVDISDPHSLSVVGSNTFSAGQARDVAVSNGYAYFTTLYALEIIDLDPPSSIEYVISLPLSGSLLSVTVVGTHAFVDSFSAGLHVVDISTPAEAAVIKTLEPFSHSSDTEMAYYDGYLYIVGWGSGMKVYDVDPIDSATLVYDLNLPAMPNHIAIEDQVAYVPAMGGGFHIVDVSTPEACELLTSFMPPFEPERVFVQGNFALLADFEQGIGFVDISLPNSPELVNTFHTPSRSMEVSVQDGIVFLTGAVSDLHIIDATNPEAAFYLNNIELEHEYHGLDVQGQFAYVGYWYLGGFHIVDIHPPEEAHLIQTVEGPSFGGTISVQEGFAVISKDDGILSFMDIDPPIWSHQVHYVNLESDEALDFDLENGYAVVACGDSGLEVVDIDPMLEANTVKQIPTPSSAAHVAVEDGYAFARTYTGIYVVDLDPLEQATIVHSVNPPGYQSNLYDFFATDGLLFVANGKEGLCIIDISQPESASILLSVDTPGEARSVTVENGLAYVADYEGGLRIIKLW